MNLKKTLLSLVASAFAALSLQAHSLWINSFESFTHAPGHALVSLGWGHTLPMDDFLTTPDGRINLESFSLYDPNMQKSALGAPQTSGVEPKTLDSHITLERGDLSLYKLQLTDKSLPGVYQLEAKTKTGYYSSYLDSKGRKRMKMQPLDRLKDVKQVLWSSKYQAFAKSYVTVGEWKAPKALGHGLEFLPKTDLSAVRAGEMVHFDVLFEGEPVDSGAGGVHLVTAESPSFNGTDGYSLASMVIKGKAQFRMPVGGQWMLSLYMIQPVSPNGPLADMVDKTQTVVYSATLTFNVKP